MGFGQAISHNLSNMTNFSGRAGRPEFWYWVLAIWLLNLLVSLFTGGLTGRDNGFLWFIGWVISIILTLATIAVGCRRLHDTGKSGWLQLLWFIPCVGWIIMIIFWAQPGTTGDNQYGPAPARRPAPDPRGLARQPSIEKAVDDPVGGLLDHAEHILEPLLAAVVRVRHSQFGVRLGQVGQVGIEGAHHAQFGSVGSTPPAWPAGRRSSPHP